MKFDYPYLSLSLHQGLLMGILAQGPEYEKMQTGQQK